MVRKTYVYNSNLTLLYLAMTNYQNELLCANLIRIRKKNRYSQEDIAEVLDIAQSSYNRMEGGTTEISALRLFQLAKFYKIKVDAFYSDTMLEDLEIEKITDEVYYLKNKIAHITAAYKIIEKRNLELEEKLERKNRKIDVLLNG